MQALFSLFACHPCFPVTFMNDEVMQTQEIKKKSNSYFANPIKAGIVRVASTEAPPKGGWQESQWSALWQLRKSLWAPNCFQGGRERVRAGVEVKIRSMASQPAIYKLTPALSSSFGMPRSVKALCRGEDAEKELVLMLRDHFRAS